MKLSSRVSYLLYVYCKDIVNKLIKYVPSRELFKLKLNDFASWFKNRGIITFWLETYRIVSKEYVQKALHLEDSEEFSNGLSMTSVLVSDHFMTVWIYLFLVYTLESSNN